ncbi:hypothetical protein Pfo_029263, partial [Paulownia fortunei]
MASNKHGDWKEFDKYEEYRYVLAIAFCQRCIQDADLRQIHEISTGREMFSRQNIIVAYLLISAASSAVPLTNRMRE